MIYYIICLFYDFFISTIMISLNNIHFKFYGLSLLGDVVVMNDLIEHVEPLLLKYRVNIGFYGHNHVVQRQSAVFNKKVIQSSVEVLDSTGEIVHTFFNPSATVHMVIGTAGAGFTKNAMENKPKWNEMFFYKWGYARVTAINSTYLSWEWIESSSGIIFDKTAVTQILDFDLHPHWIVKSSKNDLELLSISKDENKFYTMTKIIYKLLFNFFNSGYGFIFLIILIILVAYRITMKCMSSSSASSDSYVKLPATNNLNDTILESHP